MVVDLMADSVIIYCCMLVFEPPLNGKTDVLVML